VKTPYEITFRAFDKFPDYCFILSDDGIILDVNRSFLVHSDKTREWLINQRFESILHEASVMKFEHALYTVGSKTEQHEVDCKLCLREDNFIEARIFISVNDAGKSKKAGKTLFLVIKDITETKQKEIDLLRFYFVAQNTVNPLQITDLSGKMIYVNPAFEKASGYSSKELIGNNPNVFSGKKHSRQFWDNMWQTISAGKVWMGEVENKKKNGEPFFTQVLISPIMNYDNTVIGYFGIHHDLTEKRNLEKQLIHTQKMESIGTLAAGVAHEVGNPLASISALVQIIQRQTQDEFIREKLELVKKQITRISKIIRDLVDFSRPSNYELKLTDINENVRESIEIVQVGKKAKDVDFIAELDETLSPLPLVADQMQQVFVNILINAVDAILDKRAQKTVPGKSFIKATTTFRDGYYVITFEDNGPGVKPDHLTKIFEPFFTTKMEGKGTGLGLWVSYGIVKSFQGELKVESSYGEWTKFIIYLPALPSF
jgi:PAS domain S-box-containing protein